MVATITTEVKLTNTEWLQALVVSNAEMYQQIADMVNVEGYPLHDIRDFIDTYGFAPFNQGLYLVWEELEKNYSREAIEAWIDYAGIYALESLEDAYMGEFENEEAFAEYYFTELTWAYSAVTDAISAGLVIDWEGTWETNLRHDFDFHEGFVFNRNV